MRLRHHLANIYRLGIKELWSLARDPTMLVLIVYVFTVGVYTAATAMPETLHRVPIALVDEDDTPLSQRIVSAFYPPQFNTPELITMPQMDPAMDNGEYTFALYIPQGFQRDVLAGRAPEIQLNVDATRMSQAFTGSGAVQQIVQGEINEFVQRQRVGTVLPVDLALRARFNPALEKSWFGGLMQIINYITMLSIVLTGAALIREREHGTIEHLLVMPVTPTEIMLSKIWSMGVVVLLASSFSLLVVVKGVLAVQVAGSGWLFGLATLLYLFSAASIGIFMATLANSMPQFGLMSILVLLPLQILSGSMTPRESMPDTIYWLMSLAPTTHYVSLAQSILFRDAGLATLWPSLMAVALIGALFFVLAHYRLRRTIGSMQG